MRLPTALLLLLSLIFLQGRSQVTLGSAFLLKKQDELRKCLGKGEAAVVFSGFTLPSQGVGQFVPSADFQYLVGQKVPNAVLVILSDSVEWSGKKANAFLFTPGADEFRRTGMGPSPEVPKSKWAELPSAEWGKFCGQILAGPQVKKVHLRDEYLLEMGSSRVLMVNELVNTFFLKLQPGFPFTHEAALLYKEIQNTSDSNMDELRQKISSFFTFYGFPLTSDPLLQRAMHADSHKELQELRNELASLKVDIVTFPSWIAKISQVKTVEEEIYVNNSKALAIKTMAYATNNLKVGQSEAQAAALLASKVSDGGGWLSQPVRVAAGSARAWPAGDGNLGMLTAASGTAAVPVTVELGLELDGYPAKMCRTFPVGGEYRPADAKVAAQLNDAHAELLALLKPGTALNQVVAGRSQVNDKRMKTAGIYKSDIGSELAPLFHDVQVLDTRFSGSSLPEKLAPGMILYVKTGIYFQSGKGIQPEYLQSSMEIGDMVRITETGAELLTKQ